MANHIPSVNGNQLQPRQQRRASPQEFDGGKDSDLKRKPGRGPAQEDTVELSPEALEFLRQSRLRGQD